MKTQYPLILIFLLSLNSFGAPADYSTEFNGLKNGLEISNFHFDNLWDYENPLVGANEFILPESHTAWAANYFPMKTGGAATRWQTKSMPAVDEKFPTLTEVRRMTSKEIDHLSPAEKYDIFKGDYNFSFTRRELAARGPYRSLPPEIWEGFCNGLRAAGYSIDEPNFAIDVISSDGIKVRFQPADLKLLVGVSYFYVENYQGAGSPTRGETVAEHQPNAAIFDLALRYYLAEKKKAFVIDTNLGPEVWNESVIGYSRKISRRQQLSRQENYDYPQAVAKLFVKTRLYSLGEISIEESNKPTKAKVAAGEMHTVTPIAYWLYIDKNGKAVDGRWRDQKGLRGVDFMWMSSGRGMDSKYAEEGTGNKHLEFKVLENLIKVASRSLRCAQVFSE
jgi:hypothetical protein